MSKFYRDKAKEDQRKKQTQAVKDQVKKGLKEYEDQLNVDMINATAEVVKTMASNPRRISKIDMVVKLPKSYDEKTKRIYVSYTQFVKDNIIKIIDFGFIFISLNCSATINRCSSLQIIIGSSTLSKPFNLSCVFCKKVFPSFEFMDKYCFGKLSLDNGHNLDPEPPQRITGNIFG